MVENKDLPGSTHGESLLSRFSRLSLLTAAVSGWHV